jgi:hypothetical protein
MQAFFYEVFYISLNRLPFPRKEYLKRSGHSNEMDTTQPLSEVSSMDPLCKTNACKYFMAAESIFLCHYIYALS